MNTKKILVSSILLTIIIGVFLYIWYVWIPKKLEKESEDFTKTQPPTLFSKEDYKIEEREDGRYIVVEKVGLTAKVPDDWEIKFEGSDYPEPEYWVNLYSPEAEVFDILTKGCGIGITVGTAKEKTKELNERIQYLQKNIKEVSDEQTSELVKINKHLGVRGITENLTIGKAIAINIPLGEKIIRLDTLFPPKYENKCSPIWKEFLKNIVIE